MIGVIERKNMVGGIINSLSEEFLFFMIILNLELNIKIVGSGEGKWV